MSRVQPVEGDAITEPPPVHAMATRAGRILAGFQTIVVSQEKLKFFELCWQGCLGVVSKEYFVESAKVTDRLDTPHKKDVKVMQKLFKINEESNCCNRMLFRNIHPFKAEVYQGKSLTYIIERPLRMDTNCCCYRQTALTKDLNGNILGRVDEELNVSADRLCGSPMYTIKHLTDEGSMETWAELHGGSNLRTWLCGCGFDPTYEIRYPGESKEAGKITKKDVFNIVSEMFGADRFLIYIPEKATPQQRLTLLTATMLMDFNHHDAESSCKPRVCCNGVRRMPING